MPEEKQASGHFKHVNKKLVTGVAGAATIAAAGLFYIARPNGTEAIYNIQATPTSSAEIQIEAAQFTLPDSDGVDFIVRFDDLPPIKECRSLFREDRAAAKTYFDNWAADHRELAGLRLKKASYSGEMVLTWSPGTGSPTREQVLAVRDRIQSLGMVRYADPDFTAYAEGDR